MTTNKMLPPFTPVLGELIIVQYYHEHPALAPLPGQIFVGMQHPPTALAVPMRYFLPLIPHNRILSSSIIIFYLLFIIGASLGWAGFPPCCHNFIASCPKAIAMLTPDFAYAAALPVIHLSKTGIFRQAQPILLL